MNGADLKLIDQYKWLIPEERIPLTQVIEKIKAKFNATQMESGDIPLLWMHKFNAVHLPRNEELGLTEAQLMQGLPADTSEASEEMMDFRHYLKSYHELYGTI